LSADGGRAQEPQPLGLLARERDRGIDQPPLLHAQARAQPASSGERRGRGVNQRQAAREPGIADLLGPALQPAAQQRDVLVT
jgi:hypothetical protein